MSRSLLARKGGFRASCYLLLLVAILTTQQHTTIVCQAKNGHHSSNRNNGYSSNRRRDVNTLSDLYQILGVSPKASLEEMKRNYRTLAKEHHPDKGGDPDTFTKIANAYETLSDPAKRRQYDQAQMQQSASRRAQFARQQKQKEEEKLRQAREREEQLQKQKRRVAIIKEVRPMQNRLLRIHTVEEMIQEGIINRNMVFVKNFVGVFVANKNEEKIVDNEFLFPYPFSGTGRNGIVWQTVMQTAKIRYNKPTELTALFKVHKGSRTLPHIVFGRAGESIESIDVFAPRGLRADPQEHLEQWVMDHLSNRITVINRHHSPVKLFLILDQTKPQEVLIRTLGADHAMPFNFHIGDKIVAVDARVDAFPGAPNFDSSSFLGIPANHQHFKQSFQSPNPESWHYQNPAILGEYLVGIETTLEIEEEYCFDLSLKCQHWTTFGKSEQEKYKVCQEQATFMHHICPASCGICTRKQNSWLHAISYRLRDAPLYDWPHWIRPIVQFFRFAWQDLLHVLAMRRTIALVFWILGAVLGANAFLLPAWLFGSGKVSPAVHFTWRDIGSYVVLSATVGVWAWFHFVASPIDSSLRGDWDHVLAMQKDAMHGLIGWGASLAIVIKVIVNSFWRRKDNLVSWSTKVVYSLLALIAFASLTAVLVVVAIDMGNASARKVRWRHLWKIRKNIAVALVYTGIALGLSLGSLWKGLRRFTPLLVLAILDMAVAAFFDILSMSDRYFMKDLDHVLHLRMSAAIPIAIFGLLVGFGVPFGIWEMSPPTHPATWPAKLKAD